MRDIKRWACCWLAVTVSMLAGGAGAAESNPLEAEIRRRAAAVEQKVIQWRRDIHQHPELGDQEKRTAALVAEHLRELDLEVRTEVARTGVVGVLKGAKAGPVVALRADMDALPVQEPKGLPFASTAIGEYQGQQVPLMHACGHDAHTAMLMGAAEVLSGMKDELAGTVVFIFQPAEEGSSLYSPASGKSWGAKLMLEEGLFKELKPDAVFALHVMPGPLGTISYRAGPITASSDDLQITVNGKQGHGGMPWNTIDPIATSALVISGLQTVVSRRTDLTQSPAVVTIGTINGGSRANVIPDSVHMSGTIRTYGQQVRRQVTSDTKLTAKKIAESTGATAEVTVTPMYDTTVNDESLLELMLPVLKRAADGRIAEGALSGASEDFSFFAQEAPGLYVFLGITPQDQHPAKAAPNHSPHFFVDERALVVGTRTLGYLTVNFLGAESEARQRPRER